MLPILGVSIGFWIFAGIFVLLILLIALNPFGVYGGSEDHQYPPRSWLRRLRR